VQRRSIKTPTGHHFSQVRSENRALTIKNRSRVEILHDIVAAACASARKTELMYKSNLSFTQLDLYLKFLIHRQLVEERFDLEANCMRYYITNKGLRFLELFANLKTYLREETLPSIDSESLRFVASPARKNKAAADAPQKGIEEDQAPGEGSLLIQS
jgi:predicted transcriptional regulator